MSDSIKNWIGISLLAHTFFSSLIGFYSYNPNKEVIVNARVVEQEQEDKKDLRDLKEAEKLKRELLSYHQEGLKDDAMFNGIVPKQYLKREFNYVDIILKDVLFSVNTLKTPLDMLVKGERQLKNMDSDRMGNGVELMIEQEPLFLHNKKREELLGKMMILPKAKQFMEFEEYYLRLYDKEKGDLADFFQQFYSWNMVRVTYPSNPFMRAVSSLEESLSKNHEYRVCLEYLSSFPGTKVSAAMLFAMEKIYHSQETLLIELFNAYPQAKERESERGIMKETIIRVYEQYKNAFAKESLLSIDDIINKYDAKRAEILNQIAQSGKGEYGNDALYELGAIYMLKNDYSRAKDYFGLIDRNANFRYKKEAIEVSRLIERKANVSEIIGLINYHEKAYLDFLDERAVKFVWGD